MFRPRIGRPLTAISAIWSAPTYAQGNQALVRPPCRSLTCSLRCAVPGGWTSTSACPSGVSSSRTRRSKAIGSPPIPMFPSASRTVIHRPVPGTWPKTSRSRVSAPAAREMLDGVGRDVDAEGGDAALGQRDGQASGTRPDVKRRAVAAIHDGDVARPHMQPVVHLERRRSAVGMLYFRPCAPGEGIFVKFADHAGLLPRQAAGRRPVFTRRTPADAWIGAALLNRHGPYGVVTDSFCFLVAPLRIALPCNRDQPWICRAVTRLGAPWLTTRTRRAGSSSWTTTATVADVVGRYLVRDGHTVECVHDGYEALRRIADQPAGPGRARPDAAGHRRPRGLQAAARAVADPGRHADRARRGDRPPGRLRDRRRRLRDQAVQPARAGDAGPLGAAPGARQRPAGRRDAGRLTDGEPDRRPGGARGPARRRG